MAQKSGSNTSIAALLAIPPITEAEFDVAICNVWETVHGALLSCHGLSRDAVVEIVGLPKGNWPHQRMRKYNAEIHKAYDFYSGEGR